MWELCVGRELVRCMDCRLTVWTECDTLMERPSELGPRDGKLASCPASPNCVSTCDVAAVMQPIPFFCTASVARDQISEALVELPRCEIIICEMNYVHAEVRTKWLRFVDDVEFLIDSERRWIHFRSASRLGYWDFGVNRRRMEALGQRLYMLCSG